MTAIPMRRVVSVLLAGVLAIAPAAAQELAGVEPQPLPAIPPTAALPPVAEQVVLTAGRSTVLSMDFNVTRIAITDPVVADAVVVEPREILIDAKAPGTVSLIVWGDVVRRQYDLVVDPGVSTLQQQLRGLFPGEDILVSYNESAIVLHGSVSSNDIMLRVAEIARATSADAEVINMLQLPGGNQSQQVMLQVRFAEVNRRALQELGFSAFSNRDGFTARSTTQQFPAPDFNEQQPILDGDLIFSDYLNLFFFQRTEGIGAVLRALEQQGYFQSLAEPNLIAYNNQEASFLAGGEFPIPIIQGVTGVVTIVFKEFGVRLTFTPTIAGDVIRLRVMPEVSSLDFNNGLTLEGFRIPALITRRAQTVVELRDGQSFAIAGLLDNVAQEDTAGIPILSKLPIIGALFKSKAARSEQTELMVLITPRLVRPLDPDEVPMLPTSPDRFLPSGEVPGEGFGDGALMDAPPVEP